VALDRETEAAAKRTEQEHAETIADLRSQLSESLTRVSTLFGQKRKLSDTVDRLEKEIGVLTRVNSGLKADNEANRRLSADVKALKAENAELRETIAETQQELTRARLKNSDLVHDNAHLKDRIARKQNELEALIEDPNSSGRARGSPEVAGKHRKGSPGLRNSPSPRSSPKSPRKETTDYILENLQLRKQIRALEDEKREEEAENEKLRDRCSRLQELVNSVDDQIDVSKGILTSGKSGLGLGSRDDSSDDE
jgi:chromosome segregation ATPase